jgi:PAS domain S-box-containing protein
MESRVVERSGTQTLLRLKQLERELRISPEALFEHPEVALAVFEAVTDAIVIIDNCGIIRLLNHEAEAMFGWARDQLIGKNVSVLIPERYRDAHAAKQEAYFRNPYVRRLDGLCGLRRSGEEFPVMIALHPLRSAGDLVMATLRGERHDATANGP